MESVYFQSRWECTAPLKQPFHKSVGNKWYLQSKPDNSDNVLCSLEQVLTMIPVNSFRTDLNTLLNVLSSEQSLERYNSFPFQSKFLKRRIGYLLCILRQ